MISPNKKGSKTCRLTEKIINKTTDLMLPYIKFPTHSKKHCMLNKKEDSCNTVCEGKHAPLIRFLLLLLGKCVSVSVCGCEADSTCMD